MAWALAKCNPPAPDLLSAIAARTVEVLCQAPPPDAPSIANRRPGSTAAFSLPASGGSGKGSRVRAAAALWLSPSGGSSRRLRLAAPEEDVEDGEADDDGEEEDEETTGGSGDGGGASGGAAAAEAMRAARAEVVLRACAAGELRFDGATAGRPPQRQKVCPWGKCEVLYWMMHRGCSMGNGAECAVLPLLHSGKRQCNNG